MIDSPKPYLDIIRQTRRCRPDIEDTAQKLAALSRVVFDDLVKKLKVEQSNQAPPDQGDAAPLSNAPKSFKTVLVPENSTAFCRACKTVPSPIAAKAIKAIAAFAAADEDIWRVTRPIKRIAECYRIRVGRSYRLLLRWEPDRMIQVLDLIPRAQLEAWIRKNC